MVPSTAKFVTTIPYHQVSIYDVSQMLPQHPTKHYNRRERPIDQIYIHKSGADGPPGYKGYQACAFYCVNHRKWPGVPYHFWLAREPDYDTNANMVIYQGQPEDIVSWHTGGANTWSVGIGVQGNYDGDWDLVDGIPDIQKRPTPKQLIMLDALVTHLAKQLQLDITTPAKRPALSGHWEGPRPKAVCPGDALRLWVMERRESTPPPKSPIIANAPVSQTAISDKRPQKWPIKDLQRGLTILGYYPGKIDGIFGYKTRKAVEIFQRNNKLVIDGWVGRRTALALQKKLLDKGIFTTHAMHAFNLG